MAVSREQAQIDIVINGTKATSTIAEMEKAAKVLNNQIKNLTPGTQEFIDKSKELQGVNAKLGETRNAVKGVSDQTKELTGNMTKLSPVGGILGDISDKAQSLKDGFTQISGSVKTFGGALAATGIGLFLLAISSLIAYFKQTDEGATKLEGIMKGLGFAIKQITNIFVDFGKTLVGAVEDPQKAFSDFLAFLKDQVIARIESVAVVFGGLKKLLSGDFTAGLKDVTDGALQMTLGIRNGTDAIAAFGNKISDAAKEGYDLAQAMDALADAQRDFSVTSAENETRISQLLLQAKNRSLSEQERIALLKQASALEQANFNKQVEFANQNLELIRRENAAIKTSVDLNDEAAQKEVDAQLAVEALKQKSIELQEKINNRSSALYEELEKERQRIAQEGLGADKNIADLKISNMEEGFKKQMAQLQLNYEREKEAVIGNETQINEQKKLLKEQFDQEKKALEEANYLAGQEANVKRSDAELEDAILQNSLKYSTQLGSEQEQADALYEIQKAALERKQELLIGDDEKTLEAKRKTDNELIKLEIERNKQITANKKKSSADNFKIEQAQLNATKGITGDLLDLMVEAQGEQAKQTEGYKAIASANLIISGIQEVGQIWKSVFEIFPYPVAVGLGAVQTGIAVARTAIGLNKINSVKPAGKSGKYGMLVHGSAHGSSYGQGGIALIDRVTGEERGEMEGNEIVLTGGVTRNPQLRARASALNQAGGGVAFAGGGMVDVPGTSSATATEFSGVTPDAIMKGFEANNDKLVNSIDARFDRLTVQNSYTDNEIYDAKIKAIRAERTI